MWAAATSVRLGTVKSRMRLGRKKTRFDPRWSEIVSDMATRTNGASRATGTPDGASPKKETSAGRLVLVSNRLPVTATLEDGHINVTPSSGGLATGLRGPHEGGESLWIGWPGPLPRLNANQTGELREHLTRLRTVPVELSQRDVRGFYDGISNGVLWPLLHYTTDRMPVRSEDWTTYVRVNQRFADVVAEHYRPGDLVWVHDYQLALVPQLLRERLPNASIGFFLHTPFPSSEVFSVLPWRQEMLRGLLGADLIGFHTASYLRNFAMSVSRFLGGDLQVDRITFQDHEARLGVFPMGIDAVRFAALAASDAVTRQMETILAEASGRKILVGIDRLDYTKGIPTRLLAIEKLLENNPEMHDQIRVIQVIVPSREKVDAYARLRRQIDEIVGRINSRYATASSVPIHHLYRSLDESEVAALYRAADVMVVTPLRDGMNLVAKEFVASRDDENGVLVLSEFAGAAAELGDAIRVNPHDIDAVARRIVDALTMPLPDRRVRMRSMRERVFRADVHHWLDSFVTGLKRASADRSAHPVAYSSDKETADLVARAKDAEDLTVILDYDGTLMPFYGAPADAAPDAEVLHLLQTLAARPRTSVHIVSGRTRSSLERWLGDLPIGIYAEHGFWSRPTHDAWWQPVDGISFEWKERVRPILEHFTSITPGALVEEKTASIAWHHRMSGEGGARQAKDLQILLEELLSNTPVEVIEGDMVVEIRPQGVNKGNVARAILSDAPPATTVLAIGDDATDEDLFGALPEASLTVHVGPRPSVARYRVAEVATVRSLLHQLANGAATEGR